MSSWRSSARRWPSPGCRPPPVAAAASHCRWATRGPCESRQATGRGRGHWPRPSGLPGSPNKISLVV